MTDTTEPRHSAVPDLRLFPSDEVPSESTAARIALRRSPRAHKPRTPPPRLRAVPSSEAVDAQTAKKRGGRKKNRRRQHKGISAEAPAASLENAEQSTTVGAASTTHPAADTEPRATSRKSKKRPRKPAKRGRAAEESAGPVQTRSDEEFKGGVGDMSPGSGSPSGGGGGMDLGVSSSSGGPSAAALPSSDSKPKRKKRRTPYSKLSWQEQMGILEHEAERARRQDDREEERLRRIRPEQLAEVRPKAPRNTTQFLIDSHASDNEDSLKDGDEIEIDEHGTMTEHSGQLLAIREELRKRQRAEHEESSAVPPLPESESAS